MEYLTKKYADKLVQAGLGHSSGIFQPVVGGLDDTLVWNRCAEEIQVLEKIFTQININSLVFLKPAPPYGDIIRYLADAALKSDRIIHPADCETRTFLHDLPVVDKFDASMITQTLKKRKSVIIMHGHDNYPGVIAHGSVSPEQGFVTISSVCFACFVKFFADYLQQLQEGYDSRKGHDLYDKIILPVKSEPRSLPKLIKGPFRDTRTVHAAIIEAGLKTVEYSLVDSYFGNISCLHYRILYISQTGASLDELAGCIDPVPMDGSTSAGITASSELSAHMKIVCLTGRRTILHGHPKFSVIMSMDCNPDKRAKCRFKGQCHIKCPEKRSICNIPIVPGEVGTGPFGLCNTLPQAFEKSCTAIVYGHGVFAAGRHDFSDAFAKMMETENMCHAIYTEKIDALRKKARII